MKKTGKVLALLGLCVSLAACNQAPEQAETPTATAVPTATQAVEPTATTAPTAMPEATATTAPTATPEPTATTAPTATPEPTATPTPIPDTTAEVKLAETDIPGIYWRPEYNGEEFGWPGEFMVIHSDGTIYTWVQSEEETADAWVSKIVKVTSYDSEAVSYGGEGDYLIYTENEVIVYSMNAEGYAPFVGEEYVLMEGARSYREDSVPEGYFVPNNVVFENGGSSTEAPASTPSPTSEPTATPMPTATVAPTATPEPTATPVPTKTVIGNEDCTTAWWTAFSDIVKVEAGTAETILFKNYTGGEKNWHNFVAVLQNVEDAHGADANPKYSEYAAVRADNYGWSGALNSFDNLAELGWNLESNWNWDAFLSDMNGATVELTVTNYGTTADVVANVTTASGTAYFQKYQGIAVTGDLYYCLTVEGGYLEILEPSTTAVVQVKPTEAPKPTTAPVETTGKVIGNEDCSTVWWTDFSDTVKVEAGKTEKVTFKNFTNGEKNWNNFVVVLQSVPDKHDDASKEYAVVRADNYGWGSGYGTATLESNWNWDTFTTVMNGATVEVEITNHGTSADVVANITAATGEKHFQKYLGIAITGDLYYCLTVENGYLVLAE